MDTLAGVNAHLEYIQSGGEKKKKAAPGLAALEMAANESSSFVPRTSYNVFSFQ